MKRLYNEYSAYNKEGQDFYTAIRKAVEPIIKEWSHNTYDKADIESIAVQAITSICAENRIAAIVAQRRKERKAKNLGK